MKYARGIPDDTPENIVKAVIEIINEEAASLGAQVERESKLTGLSVFETIDIFRPSHDAVEHVSVRILLNYVHSSDLHLVKVSLGGGFLGGSYFEGRESGERWDIHILPREDLSYVIEPPYRMGLYPPGANEMLDLPTHILDGQLLRTLLRERLQFPLPL